MLCVISDVDPVAIQIAAGCSVQNQPLSWNGGSHGAHYSVGQATLQNCVPIIQIGCWWTSHHVLEFWAYGNGTWRARGV